MYYCKITACYVFLGQPFFFQCPLKQINGVLVYISCSITCCWIHFCTGTKMFLNWRVSLCTLKKENGWRGPSFISQNYAIIQQVLLTKPKKVSGVIFSGNVAGNNQIHENESEWKSGFSPLGTEPFMSCQLVLIARYMMPFEWKNIVPHSLSWLWGTPGNIPRVISTKNMQEPRQGTDHCHSTVVSIACIMQRL